MIQSLLCRPLANGSIRLLSALLLLLSPAVHAGTFTCAIASASGISLSYDPSSATQTAGMGTVAINCTKSGGNSDTVYYELGISGGVNLSANQSRAVNGASAIAYNTWRDVANSQVWNDLTNNRIKGSVSGTASTTVYVDYYVTVPAAQNVGAGTYLDTQTVKLYQGTTAAAASTAISPTLQTFGVTLAVAAKCALSSPPGNVNFAYTSFQTTQSVASTSFAVTCSNNTTYTLSLDSATGTLLGLNYNLSLNKTGVQTGNGLAQSATINGTVASGQSGICTGSTCTASEVRTLTITY